ESAGSPTSSSSSRTRSRRSVPFGAPRLSDKTLSSPFAKKGLRVAFMSPIFLAHQRCLGAFDRVALPIPALGAARGDRTTSTRRAAREKRGGASPVSRAQAARDAGLSRDQKRDALRTAPVKVVSDRGTRVYQTGIQADRVELNLAALPTA